MAKTKQKNKEQGQDQEEKKGNKLRDDVLEIRRVTRVMAGGKRFSFRATVVVGNKNGKVGVGTGKGADVAKSISKAKADAKKNMIEFKLEDGRTIPHDVEVKYGAAELLLKPTSEGHGLIAGGPIRTVLDLAGIQDISAKMLGSTSNKLNNARCAVKALKTFEKSRFAPYEKNAKEEDNGSNDE